MSPASSQVTALCGRSTTIKDDAAKRQDLRKRARPVVLRPIAATKKDRARKFAVETGYDLRHDTFLKAPLEPWTCPQASKAMILYGTIRTLDDGKLTLDDFNGVDLDHLRYMHDEQLIEFGLTGTIHMLDDPDGKSGRSYPGSGMADKRAAVGKQLRDRADSIVLAAILNLARRRTVSKIPARMLADLVVSTGLKSPVRLICQEANAIKRHRRDLDECRFLSVDTCSRVLKRLRMAEVIEEAEPPRSIRACRQWIGVPRVYRTDNLPGIAVFGSPPERIARAA